MVSMPHRFGSNWIGWDWIEGRLTYFEISLHLQGDLALGSRELVRPIQSAQRSFQVLPRSLSVFEQLVLQPFGSLVHPELAA